MNRSYRDAAQGVERWYRQLGGRWFMFTFVTAGWWGVGETGDLTVWAPISNGDYYPIKRFHGVRGKSGWHRWASLGI